MTLRLLPLICVMTVAGCFTPQFRLPPSSSMYKLLDSPHFQGFYYSTLEQTLRVVKKDGSEVTHYQVPREVAHSFARDGGHLGYYEQAINKLYSSTPQIEINGRAFLPVVSGEFSGVSYDGGTRELFLLKGEDQVTVYLYVPIEVYEGFLEAPVKGSYFAGFIRNRYEIGTFKVEDEEAPESGQDGESSEADTVEGKESEPAN